LLLFGLFILYPRVASIVLRLYSCVKVGVKSYLTSDFTVQCYTSTWTRFAAANGIFLLLYPLGIPLLFVFLLYRERRNERFLLPEVRYQLGFLYEVYQVRHWWWESVDLANKLIMTSILPFFDNAALLPVALAATVAYLALLLWQDPYIHEANFRLHILAQADLFLFLLAAYVISTGQLYDATSDAVFSTLLIIAAAGFLCLFLVQAWAKLRLIYPEVLVMLLALQRVARAVWSDYTDADTRCGALLQTRCCRRWNKMCCGKAAGCLKSLFKCALRTRSCFTRASELFRDCLLALWSALPHCRCCDHPAIISCRTKARGAVERTCTCSWCQALLEADED